MQRSIAQHRPWSDSECLCDAAQRFIFLCAFQKPLTGIYASSSAAHRTPCIPPNESARGGARYTGTAPLGRGESVWEERALVVPWLCQWCASSTPESEGLGSSRLWWCLCSSDLHVNI